MAEKGSHTVLVVDDDPGHRGMLEALLGRWGLAVTSAGDGKEAVARVCERPFDVVLMDIRMPDMDGITALKEVRKYNPAVPVVLMTAYSAVESAVEAMKSGAVDYLIKPLDFDQLKSTLFKTLEHSEAVRSGERFPVPVEGIVGNSPAVRRMLEMIHTVAPSEATVLINGKSGTGKELVARAIHNQSQRKDGPWVAVNCAALTESLLESELFGHEKGAFTGADKRRDGRFLQADGGTLFLDEIGEISLLMQVKLLRAIQQREIQRVGGDATLKVDVRIVAATNRNLLDEVAAGRFREDLYYRLNVVSIQVPSLQERSEDIPLLAEHFLKVFGERNRKDVKGFTPKAMDKIPVAGECPRAGECGGAGRGAAVRQLRFGTRIAACRNAGVRTRGRCGTVSAVRSFGGGNAGGCGARSHPSYAGQCGRQQERSGKAAGHFPQDPAYQAQTVRAGAGLITPGAPCCAARRRSGAVPYSRVRSNTVR